ncbi:MAG: class I SAM-dependent methyltransferase [Imperialibacter sp.]|uniref:class I SAM-dependent methyltransferase n=1 Tax=Imperialibacter sp. TaxID=2038411 RepID=UPI0032EF3708
MQTSQARYEQAKELAANFFFVKRNIKAPAEAAKGANFTYVSYRLLRPVLKTYYWIFKQFNPMTAWTSPASIVIFRNLLKKDMKGVEFGSGKSTAFFAQHLGHLTSIEHHKGWHEKVQAWMKERNISNVDYRLVEPDEKEKPFPAPMLSYFPEGLETKKGFVNYVSELLTFDDNSIDFLLVDGRARTECALIGIHKLKSGGLLVLDNAERDWYKPVHEAVKDWPCVFTTTGLTDTVIWFKP